MLDGADAPCRPGVSSGTRHSSRLPILDAQLGDARELPNAVRDEDRAMDTGCRCNQQIVRSDWRSRAVELIAKQAVLLCATVVERKAGDRIEESLQQAQVLSAARALPGAVEKLGFDDRGEPHHRAGDSSQAIDTRRRRSVQ